MLPSFSRYRPEGVFGKGIGNSKNASEMRQKCIQNASEMRQNGSCIIRKKRNVQNASEICQNCVKNARNIFGREHLLDDTDSAVHSTVVSKELVLKLQIQQLLVKIQS